MDAPTQILVVDDEATVRSLLCQGLEQGGFAVSEAADKHGLMRALEAGAVALVTLDLNLAGEDGLRLARQVRSKFNVPIIMITGRSDPADRVSGLEYGADDYITKPFHIREVLLRVRNVLGRYERTGILPPRPGDERYAFESGLLDVNRREVRGLDGAPLDITDLEREILTIFLRYPQRVLSRDDLMQVLKGQSWSPMDRTLDGHIARLRRKIERAGEEAPRLIKSVRGVGYVYTGEVTRL
jgi:DNA-binding response OmpR family regulator